MIQFTIFAGGRKFSPYFLPPAEGSAFSALSWMSSASLAQSKQRCVRSK